MRDRDHSMALLSTTLGTNEKTDERESEMPFAEDVSKIDEMEKDEKTDEKEPELSQLGVPVLITHKTHSDYCAVVCHVFS